MKINQNLYTNKYTEINKNKINKEANPETNDNQPVKDEIQLSDAVKELYELQQEGKEDISVKAKDIKQQISAGTYELNTEKMTSGIISRMMV
jgi:anti-sigma28 factor (negative regulator of flagellin synthesis)